jgi:tetratricopeptide (TPR) repeat protein
MQARTHRALRNYKEAVLSLNDAMQLSNELDEHYGDVDTLGMLADVHVEMGEIEKASLLYDQVIQAIQVEDLTAPASSTWDC